MAEDSEVDIQAILARLNATADENDDDDTPEPQNEEQQEPQLEENKKDEKEPAALESEDPTEPEIDLRALINRTLNLVGDDDTTTKEPSEEPTKPENTQHQTDKPKNTEPVADPAEPSAEEKPHRLTSQELQNKMYEQMIIVKELDEDAEFLMKQSKSINISDSIWKATGSNIEELDPSPINSITEAIMNIFNKNAEKVVIRQRLLFDQMAKVRYTSDGIGEFYKVQYYRINRMKTNELDKKLDEIQAVEKETQKNKTYLNMLLKRLEEMESKLGEMIAAKKQKKAEAQENPKK